MGDRGTLGGVAVVDVQIDEAGVVHHVLAGELPAVGAEIAGEIDRARRRVHMSLHTGQHMLSRALADLAAAETVSSRLGETECTIDVDRETIDESRLAASEELVNSIVEDDLLVRAFFPDEAELRALPLRRQPKVTDRVRVVDVGGFDVSPCGGTHCARTAQVGAIRVTGIERYKGKVRVTFAAGRRARAQWSEEARVLARLAQGFTCGPSDVPAAVEKLQRDLANARTALGHVQGRLAETVAATLLAEAAAAGRTEVVALVDGGDRDFVRAMAAKIAAREGMTALLATRTAEGLAVACVRGAGSTVDCGAFLKRAAAAAGGRGGGRPEAAEGRVPAEADWVAIANRTLEEMRGA
jgi:alanyl-tRNA synthetase